MSISVAQRQVGPSKGNTKDHHVFQFGLLCSEVRCDPAFKITLNIFLWKKMFFLCFIQSLLIQRFNLWSQVYVVKLLTLPQHGVILGFERFSCLLDSLSAGGFEIR